MDLETHLREKFPKDSLVYGYYSSRDPRFFRVLGHTATEVILVCVKPTQANHNVAVSNATSFGEPFRCKVYKTQYLIDSEDILLKSYPGGDAKRKGKLYFDRILILRGTSVSESNRTMLI